MGGNEIILRVRVRPALQRTHYEMMRAMRQHLWCGVLHREQIINTYEVVFCFKYLSFCAHPKLLSEKYSICMGKEFPQAVRSPSKNSFDASDEKGTRRALSV